MSLSLKETFGRQYSIDADGSTSAVRIYFAFSSTSYVNLDVLVSDAITAGLPDLGDSYSLTSPDLVVKSHIPREIESELKVYQIEVRYGDISNEFTYPTSRDWEITFSAIYEDYVPDLTRFDTTGFTSGNNVGVAANWRITNTAGFPFDPSLVDRRGMALIKLKKHFDTIASVGNTNISNIYQLMDRQNNVNNDTVTIAGITGAPAQFWMENLEAQKIRDGSGLYYTVEFSIIYNPDYHIQKVLNAGWQEATTGDKARAITGDFGGPISNPWPLDIDGKPINGRTARRQNAIYLYFGTKPHSAFADFLLPTTF